MTLTLKTTWGCRGASDISSMELRTWTPVLTRAKQLQHQGLAAQLGSTSLSFLHRLPCMAFTAAKLNGFCARSWGHSVTWICFYQGTGPLWLGLLALQQMPPHLPAREEYLQVNGVWRQRRVRGIKAVHGRWLCFNVILQVVLLRLWNLERRDSFTKPAQTPPVTFAWAGTVSWR